MVRWYILDYGLQGPFAKWIRGWLGGEGDLYSKLERGGGGHGEAHWD